MLGRFVLPRHGLVGCDAVWSWYLQPVDGFECGYRLLARLRVSFDWSDGHGGLPWWFLVFVDWIECREQLPAWLLLPFGLQRRAGLP